jgi:hypothetical protein
MPIATLACLLGLAACDAPLSEKPPLKSTSAAPPAPTDSVIELIARLPYATIIKVADGKIPKTSPISGGGRLACLNVPFVDPPRSGFRQECGILGCFPVPFVDLPNAGMRDECADYRWSADVNKVGPLNISKAATSMRVAQGVEVKGALGLSGALAGLLSMSGKNVDIRVAAIMDVNARLDNAWCPVINVQPVGRWIHEARIEVIGRSCLPFASQICLNPVAIDLADKLNEEFDRQRGAIQQGAASILPCETLRVLLAPHWRPYAIKIDRGTQAPMFLNISPSSASFSGLLPENDHLKLVVRIGARTQLMPTSIQVAPIPLPSLGDVAAERGGLTVNLQTHAPYQLLKTELSAAIKDKVFQMDVPGGTAKVTVKDVDVYPSDSLLVVGLQVVADVPGKWLNTSGWIYLSGKPSIARQGKAMKVDNIAFSAALDQKFWSVVHVLFQQQILSFLNSRATFDLDELIAKATTQLSASISKAEIRGLKISAGTPAISLTGVHVAAEGLVVDTRLQLPMDAEITEAAIQ